MNDTENKISDFDSTSLIGFLYKYRKHLVIITIVGAIVSTIISFLIAPKYKSTVILFPPTNVSLSTALLSTYQGQRQDVLQFGQDEEVEQALQILNSDGIRGRICQKYNLMKHYDIDTADKYKRTKLYEEYTSNINFKQTEFLSIKIEVLDKNRDTAALIANDIAALYDTTKIMMQHERAVRAFQIVTSEYFKKLNEINQMTDSIAKLHSYGIYDYESQSEVTTQQYAIAIAKGDQRAMKSLEEKLKIIADYGSSYVTIRDKLELEQKQLSLLQAKYMEAKVDAEQVIPQKFIVNHAYPAEKKSYPIRWLIVVVSTLATFILAVLAMITVENFSAIRLKK
jgi:uncharacterized protein involved in exopolysaccharide biosynthesis